MVSYAPGERVTTDFRKASFFGEVKVLKRWDDDLCFLELVELGLEEEKEVGAFLLLRRDSCWSISRMMWLKKAADGGAQVKDSPSMKRDILGEDEGDAMVVLVYGEGECRGQGGYGTMMIK